MGQGTDSIDQTPDGFDIEEEQGRLVALMNRRYEAARTASTGSNIVCPACGSRFAKSVYNKVFCSNQRTKGARNCKDRYWNTVTEIVYA